jgi:hypothetical protein
MKNKDLTTFLAIIGWVIILIGVVCALCPCNKQIATEDNALDTIVVIRRDTILIIDSLTNKN